MNARVLTNEFAKMRHLHVWLLVAVLFVVVAGIGLYTAVINPDFDRVTASSWNTLLGGIGSGFSLAAPLLLAAIASRHVDAEHQGGGWLLSATSGLTPGGLCRAKLLALGLLVTGVTVSASVLFAATGFAFGIDAPWPAGRWIGLTLCVLVVNLVVLALHIVLAARIENQLVGIGIGLLGTILALFSTAVPAWIAHLTPWGYYALSSASGYVDGVLVAFSPAYASIAGLGLVAAVVFALFTRSFDHQEI
ncbi:ABC transporter permease [Brevibacterium senegalense]|uniref:ABC transporter permease n=1 Tax=Brevibacterium senegalense TaxID=1033736 RepID=UPI00047469A0|nr:ABC transporter permease [Brevibacterium senegalense]